MMSIQPENLTGKNGGYVLLELLFYISFFAAMSLAVVSALITMTSSFAETATYAKIAESAGIMERIAREVRAADDIVSVGAGSLKLSATDAAGTPQTTEFLVDGSNLKLLENGILVGNLNAPGINISALSFTQITTAAGKAVKVSMTVGSNNDKLARTFDFYSTAVLRGNY